MRVLMFGRLADAAGWRERMIDEPPETLDALRALITTGNAALADALAAKGVRVAVDKAIVRGAMSLAGAAEVAFLAPMSGG